MVRKVLTWPFAYVWGLITVIVFYLTHWGALRRALVDPKSAGIWNMSSAVTGAQAWLVSYTKPEWARDAAEWMSGAWGQATDFVENSGISVAAKELWALLVEIASSI